MSKKKYARIAHMNLHTRPDWRWRRAAEVANGDPHGGRYADDESTLRAVRAWAGVEDSDLGDIRAARAVHQAGGWRRRMLEALLLTDWTDAEVADRTGLTEPVVKTYTVLLFDVRGDDPLSKQLRAEEGWADDPLRKAAGAGPAMVQATALWEAGGAGLSVELAERFERSRLLDRLFDTDPGAYLRAVDRLHAIDAEVPPGALHRRRWPRG